MRFMLDMVTKRLWRKWFIFYLRKLYLWRKQLTIRVLGGHQSAVVGVGHSPGGVVGVVAGTVDGSVLGLVTAALELWSTGERMRRQPVETEKNIKGEYDNAVVLLMFAFVCTISGWTKVLWDIYILTHCQFEAARSCRVLVWLRRSPRSARVGGTGWGWDRGDRNWASGARNL